MLLFLKIHTYQFECVFVEVVDKLLEGTKVQTFHWSQGLIFIKTNSRHIQPWDMHHASPEPDPPFRSIQSHTLWKGLRRHNHPHAPLVDPLVVDHLVLGQDVPVVAQEVLGFLEFGNRQDDISQARCRMKDSLMANRIQVTIHDVNKRRSSLQVLKVDIPVDGGLKTKGFLIVA